MKNIIYESLTDGPLQKTTTVIAGSAAASPVWLPWLREVSQIAALLLPIFGVIWLVVQIAIKLRNRTTSPK